MGLFCGFPSNLGKSPRNLSVETGELAEEAALFNIGLLIGEIGTLAGDVSALTDVPWVALAETVTAEERLMSLNSPFLEQGRDFPLGLNRRSFAKNIIAVECSESSALNKNPVDI